MSMRLGLGLGLSHMGRAGGAAAWTPAELFASGEEGALYDPSDLSTLWKDTGGTAPVTSDGDLVARMDDKSGNGRHATQGTAAARPLYKTSGGLHWLLFDGVDDFLSVAVDGIAAYPIVIAAAARALANQEGSVISLNQSDSAYKALYKCVSLNQWLVADRNASTLTTGETIGDNTTPHVLLADFGSASLDLEMDGQNNIAAAANSNAFGTPTTIFVGKTRPAGLFLSGHMYGGLLIDRALSSDERADLRTYLAAKAGVSL